MRRKSTKEAVKQAPWLRGLPINRTPEVEAYFTHYFALAVNGDKLTAYGEAGDVKPVDGQPGRYSVHLIEWGVNPTTSKMDPTIVTSMTRTTLGGVQILVPKGEAADVLDYVPPAVKYVAQD